MTKYRGQILEPKLASRSQARTIQEILEINRGLVEVLQRRDELFSRLENEQGCPLVAKVKVPGEDGKMRGEWRTFIVDSPQGHYVFYKSVDFTMNAMTSKEDRAVLNLATRVVHEKAVQEVPRSGRARKKSPGQPAELS